MKTVKDACVPMRDGIKLTVDIYAPDGTGKFPALLAYCPYGKDVQKLPIAQGPVNFIIGNGGIEAGISEYFVSKGYVHIIAECRGTGQSEGEYRFFSRKEQEDGYDLVEWIAAQPWCDGNVGMVGMSYFAMIQYLVAAQNPPHLKAIFAYDAMSDIYRQWFYHGGILNYGFLFYWWPHLPVHTLEPLEESEADLKKMIQEARDDLDVQANPVAWVTLGIQEKNMPLFDALTHPTDGPYYWERSGYTKFNRIKVPAYLLSRWNGQGAHLPGAFSAYLGIDAPKKLRVGLPEMAVTGFGRPWSENHDLIVRWYDHWLKGIDTGIMDEPPISIYVQEKNTWRFEYEWPLARTKWTKFYLRQDGELHEEAPTSHEPGDSFVCDPGLRPRDEVPCTKYTTNPLTVDTEVTGPIALYFFAEIDREDANWFAEIYDVAPDGSRRFVTVGWLKASHRECDPHKSKPYKPFHPHLHRIPIIPGEINEYAVEIIDTSCLFKAGHSIQLVIKGQDVYWEGIVINNHLTNRRETQQTVHHSLNLPSHLLLPIIL